MVLDGKHVFINLNNIMFKIECTNTEMAEKLYDKYRCFFVEKYSNSRLADIYINFSFDESNFNKLSSLIQKHSKKSFLMPGIEKIKINEVDLFLSKDRFVVMDNKNNTYQIVTDNNIYSAYYVMIEIMSRSLEDYGFFVFHATAFNIDDFPIVTVGNSGSGKTTLMSKLLQIDEPKKGFLSNDRVLINSSSSKYFPLEINVNCKTIENDEKLSNYFKKNGQSIKNSTLKPHVLSDIYSNLKYVDSQEKGLFIIPKIDLTEKKKLLITESNEEYSTEVLRNNVFSIVDKECKRDLWIKKSNLSQAEREKNIDILLDKIICNGDIYTLNYGCDVHGEDIYKSILKLRRK